jgi:hypothetical protein
MRSVSCYLREFGFHAGLTGLKGDANVYSVSIYAWIHKIEALSHPPLPTAILFWISYPSLHTMLEKPLQRNLEDGEVGYIEA